jgi:hypothetical protein
MMYLDCVAGAKAVLSTQVLPAGQGPLAPGPA